MSIFAADFIDRQGRRRTGIFEAADASELRASLRAKALWPVRIRSAQTRSSSVKIPVRDLIALLHQLELQLKAGVTADEAIRQLAEDTPAGPQRVMLEQVHREVSQGHPIHQACRRFPRVFPPHLATIIEAGESSARLPEALRGLASHLAGSEDLKRTARRAMIYPAIVLTATSGLVTFLLGSVVPRFAEIFISLHLPLPAITSFLITVSEHVRADGVIALGAIFAIGMALWFARQSATFQRLRDAFVLRLPILGETVRHLATARFAAHCRLQHEAGIPLLECLETGAVLVGHAVLAGNLRHARERVATGHPLYASLPKGHDFPSFVVPALKAGETTGQLGVSLQHIEDYAAARARELVATALALLEPVLLGVLAAVVGTIALSFFLPLLSLLGSVNAR